MANEILSTTLKATQALSADFATGGVDVSQYLGYYIQAVFDMTGGDPAVGTMKLQTSEDNAAGSWVDYPNSTKNISSTSTAEAWEVYYKFHRFVRVAYVYTSGTDGIVTLQAMFTREIK